MPMQNVKITCNIGCRCICSALYWVHENKTTAVREGCRPHEPAQVISPPTQRRMSHRATSIPFCSSFGKTGNWAVVYFVADLIFQRVGKNSLHVVLLSKNIFIRRANK